MSEDFLLPYEIVESGDLATLSETIDWGVIDFAVPELWKKNKGANVTIMVCDTGITEHEDLNENILWNKAKSFVDDEDIKDVQGHGTAVAGVISAKDSGYGIIGVAPRSKIIPVKVLSNSGLLKTPNALEHALEYAKNIKPDIINMSLGGPRPQSSNFHNLIKELYSLNIPVVCAMGNSGYKYSCYPAEYLETIGVTSYRKDRNISDFSSRSNNADFAFPGENILTTSLNNKYSIVNGTSFAAPFLSGILAIIIAEYKKQNKPYTIENIKNILIQSSKDYGPSGKDKYFGHGIIDTNVLKNLF
jgi:subtilisin family serine protease